MTFARSVVLLGAVLSAVLLVASEGEDEDEVVRELLVPLPEGGHVALSTRGPSAFRVRLLLDRGREPQKPMESPMVAPDGADAPWSRVAWDSLGDDKACRLNSNDTSPDADGTTHNKTADSLEECKSLCEQASGCTGVEWGEHLQRCEFWTKPIGATSHRKGFQCFNFTDKARNARRISVAGLGSLSVSPEGELQLRGARGELLTASEPVGNPRRPPQALARSSHPGGWFQGTPGENGDEQVWSGDAIYLRSHTGKYLEAEDDQVRARWHERGAWQKMIIETKSGNGLVRHGDIVYLHTHTGHAVDAHKGEVQARWDVHGQWQEFIIERKYGAGVVQAGDHVFLKANEGQYIDVQDSDVAARWQERGVWQTLTVEKGDPSQLLRSGDGLFLQPSEGKLLAYSDDSPEVLVEEATHAAAQRWVVEKKGASPGSRIYSGDKVFIFAYSGKAMDVESSKAQVRGDKREEWQEITVEREAGTGPVGQGDKIFLKAHSGWYIHAHGEVVRAHSSERKSWMAVVAETRVATCVQTFALNGSANASSWKPEQPPWRAVDGDAHTNWMSNHSDDQWLSVDLGVSYTLSRIEIRWGEHYAESYFVQGSVDGKRWENFGLALGQTGWVVTVLPAGSRARWVRIHGRKQPAKSGLSISDIVVHGCMRTLALTSRGGHLYGRGAATYDAHRLTALAVQPQVCNRATYVPYYYSSDGYSALGVVGNGTNAHSRRMFAASYVLDGDWLSWGFLGHFELYLMPAASLDAGTQAYFALTGAPRVPPRYAFGFIASRWGWRSRDYIEDTLTKFREHDYPLDAIVLDFEWFTNESDYGFASYGEAWYQDFGFHKRTLPAPEEQLLSYQQKWHVRMGGIRKPRLGNTEFLSMARSKGWILPGGAPGGQYPPDLDRSYAFGRNLDFSKPDVRDWYARQLLHLIDYGVNLWWNDEGETDYFTYHWWNLAQIDALRSSNQSAPQSAPRKRFYSLNRAFSPGLARLGGTVWTGDINPSWEDLRRTPGIMLNWGLAGAPYTACDIGGFSGATRSELLMRWMQVGIFLPTMRVHSWLWAQPHWPWLFGREASEAIRQALELRYSLIPYHYSLAHAMFSSRSLWMRPLAMEFPEDRTASSLTTQWMDGTLLVAPVLREDSRRQVYLPEGKWYYFNTSHMVEGPVHLGGRAGANEIPVFVPPGTVLPLAPVVQSTDLLPGGPLEVQIYMGADGSFELVEDDGESVAYEVGRVRTTTIRWYDAAATLSWRSRGSVSEPGVRAFTHLTVTLFDSRGHRTVRLPPRPIRDGGTIPPSELHGVLHI